MASSYNRKSASSVSKSSRRSSVSGKRGHVSSSRSARGAANGRSASDDGVKRVQYGSSSASASADGATSRRRSVSAVSSPMPRSGRAGASAASSSTRAAAAGTSQRPTGFSAPAVDDTPSATKSNGSKSSKPKKDAKLGQRKSIKGKTSRSSRKHAPAGTDNLAVSDSEQRRRNRDMDELAAGGARRVGDIRASRAAEHAARARKRYLSYVLKLVAVVVVVLGVIFGSIAVYRSDFLAVETVTVSGATHLTDQEVTQLAAVADDSTLLRLDSAGICARLEEHPWVQSAQVSREFPHSIKITITERTPAAAVKLSKKSIWVISTDGVWLSAATTKDWKDYRRIVDVDANLSTPVAGSECTDEGILNAIKIYDGVSKKFASKIKSISAESAVKASVNLKKGVTVAFGEASDIELKEADVNTLMDRYSGSISYINVRVPDRPTYRTIDE